MYVRVGGLLEFGRAHKTTYEFDYSEQFSIKNDLDLRPDELEIRQCESGPGFCIFRWNIILNTLFTLIC